jgi:hypothetical protein
MEELYAFMRHYFSKLFIVFLSFIIGQSVYGQSSPKNISPKNYYDFFNSFVNPDSTHQFNLESKPDFSYILKDSATIFSDSTLFTSADIEFIKYQIKKGQHFKWKSNKIFGSRVISSKKLAKMFKNDVDEGWAKFNKKYKNGFATFSVPLFTIDRNTCIVYKAKRCGGLCGHGGISIYKKIKGKWTFLQSAGMIWIS